jgi:hypothetical protein
MLENSMERKFLSFQNDHKFKVRIFLCFLHKSRIILRRLPSKAASIRMAVKK